MIRPQNRVGRHEANGESFTVAERGATDYDIGFRGTTHMKRPLSCIALLILALASAGDLAGAHAAEWVNLNPEGVAAYHPAYLLWSTMANPLLWERIATFLAGVLLVVPLELSTFHLWQKKP